MARRGNGEGSIYKRADGKWVAQISVRGRYVRKYAKTKSAAIDALHEMRSRVAAGQAPKDSRALFSNVVHRWIEGPLELKDVSAGTKRTYRQAARWILPHLGSHQVGQIRRDDIEAMLLSMRSDGLSGSSLATALSVVRSIFGDYAIPNRLCLSDPSAGIKKPNTSRVRAFHVPAYEETQVVLDRAGALLRITIVILSMTGMRPGEALGLDWTDIDFERSSIRVRGTKSVSSMRVLPMPEPLAVELRTWRESLPASPIAGPVVARGTGKRADYSKLAGELREIVNALDMPGLTLHKWRHHVATVMLESGVADRTASEILGHSSPAITRSTYQHISRALATDALDLVASKTRKAGA